jgi:hypothetical protein
MKKNAFLKSWALSIKAVLLNISFHFGGDQIPRRLAFFNQFSDLCRRDIEKRNSFEIDPVAGEVDPGLLPGAVSKIRDQSLREGRRGNVFLTPRSHHHDKVTKRKEVSKILPSLDLSKGILAQDEEKSVLMLSLSKKSDGVDGERPPGP